MGALSARAGRRIYLDANIFVYALEALTPWAQLANAVFHLIDKGQATGVTSEFTLTNVSSNRLAPATALLPRSTSTPYVIAPI